MVTPLVPPDTRFSQLPRFMLDTVRVLASELVARAPLEAVGAAMLLWCYAWQQSPPGSLPDDEELLATWSRLGPRWPELRAHAMRGFVLCEDGRHYHKVLCEDVKRVIGMLERNRKRTKAARLAKQAIGKKGKLSVTRVQNRTVHKKMESLEPLSAAVGARDEPPATSKDEAPDIDFPELRDEPAKGTKENGHQKRRRAERRGEAIGLAWEPDAADRDWTHREGYDDQWIAAQAERFRDHHLAVGNQYRDWHAAWRNWVRRDRRDAGGPAGKRPRSYRQGPAGTAAAARRWLAGKPGER